MNTYDPEKVSVSFGGLDISSFSPEPVDVGDYTASIILKAIPSAQTRGILDQMMYERIFEPSPPKAVISAPTPKTTYLRNEVKRRGRISPSLAKRLHKDKPNRIEYEGELRIIPGILDAESRTFGMKMEVVNARQKTVTKSTR